MGDSSKGLFSNPTAFLEIECLESRHALFYLSLPRFWILLPDFEDHGCSSEGILAFFRGGNENPQIFALEPKRQDGQMVFPIQKNPPSFLVHPECSPGKIWGRTIGIHDHCRPGTFSRFRIDFQDQEPGIRLDLVGSNPLPILYEIVPPSGKGNFDHEAFPPLCQWSQKDYFFFSGVYPNDLVRELKGTPLNNWVFSLLSGCFLGLLRLFGKWKLSITPERRRST
jgi:hypothetical protein